MNMAQPLYGIAARIYRIVRPVRDPHYLAFIRRFPCVGCKTERASREAMHIGPHGLGQKASDLDTLPGCRPCHRELHRVGRRKFETAHNIEFAALIEMFQGFYWLEFPARAQKLKPEGEAAA